MSFSVTVLRSGSKGNATLVETPRTRLLIDCGGLAAKQLANGQLRIGLPAIDAFLFTHAYQDHINEVASRLSQVHTLPLYLHRSTYHAARKRYNSLEKLPCSLFRHFEKRSFRIGDLWIEPIPVTHGIPGINIGKCFGFVVRWKTGIREYRLGYLTDTGTVTQSTLSKLEGCHCLILESNHDEVMERESQHNPGHIRWVMSTRGHLSNEQAATALTQLLQRRPKSNLRNVILGHLSEDCNTPAKARQTIMSAIRNKHCCTPHLYCASQFRRLKPVRIDITRGG